MSDPVPRRSVILDVAIRAELHTLLLLSLYFLFAGHNRPGGGFAGGLVASAGLCLLYVSGGPPSIERVPLSPPVVLGSGMLLAVVVGLVPLVLGGQFLQSAVLEVTLPLFGTVKAGSVLLFDAGVYLVVVGVALMLLHQLGAADEPAPRPAPHDPEARP